MFNKHGGYVLDGKPPIRPRVQQVVQVSYLHPKSYHMAVEKRTEPTVCRHVRMGSNSALLIPNSEQLTQNYSPVTLHTQLSSGWQAVRSRSINPTDKHTVPQHLKGNVVWTEVPRCPNSNRNSSPYRPEPRRLQSQIMGGSCISKPNSKGKPHHHRPNKVEQAPIREEPTVIAPEPTRSYHLTSNLLDSDDQQSRQSEGQVASQSTSIPEESWLGVMDRINLGYYPFSEDSYSRHLQKILEAVRLGHRVRWHKQLDQVVRLPQEQLLPRLLQLHQQFFKWYAFTIVVGLVAAPELELFHQKLNLIKEIAELLRKNIKQERCRGGRPAVQTPSSYTTQQLRRGIRLGDLAVRMLSYSDYAELKKTAAAESTTFYKLCDLRQVKLEVVAIYRGCYFHVTLARTKPQLSGQYNLKAPSKYAIVRISTNSQEPLQYELTQEDGPKVVRAFEEKYPDFTQAEKWRKPLYNGVFLSKSNSTLQQTQALNTRACKLSTFVGGGPLNGDIYFIAKRRIVSASKSVLEQFDRNKHLIQTHRMLDDACSRLGLTIFDVLRLRDESKLRAIMVTSALVQALRYLCMDDLNYDYNDELYRLTKELLSFEMTQLKEKIFLYLNLELLFADDHDNRETAQEILTSSHWYPVEFFEALYHEFGVELDSLVLKLKKDSTYLTYNMSEFRPGTLDYNMQFRQSIGLRDIVLMLLLKCTREYKESTGIIVENRSVRLGFFPQRPKLSVPSLQVLDAWCQDTELAIGKTRSVDGEEAVVLIPYIIKLAVEIILKLPCQQTQRKTERLFNVLAHCSPELIISVMSLMALSSEVYDKIISQQYYIRTLALMHRVYSEPRARNNLYHPWEVFLTARLLNMKRMAGKEYEVEYLSDLMDCMMDNPVSERPHNPKSPAPNAYPFPTIVEENSKPLAISLADLLEWILSNIPAASYSDILFRKSDVSKNDLNRSNLSTESRSTASRKDKPLHQYIERNEATISKETYLGVIVMGNGRRHISLYWPLKNLIVHKVACGISHTIVSTLDGLYGWGENESGQLGELPGGHIRKIFNLNAVVSKLSCGSEHSCAIISGRLHMWGPKEGGIVGGDGYAFDDVECGGLHCVALKDGQVYSWGRGEGGQLGHPLNILETKQGAESTEYFLSQPRKIKGLSRIKKVACGDAHTLALTEEGKVYVFGFSYQGQLGLGLTGQSQIFQIFEPVRLDFFSSIKITDLAAGSTYSVFVSERREIFSCGLNDFHQIGIDRAVTVVEKRKDRRNEKYKKQRHGQLEFAIPNKLDYFSDSFDVKRLVCGQNHTMACVDYSGQQLYVGWGMNKHQQLGLEYCVSTTPRTIANLQRVPITEICCGNTFTLALTGNPGDRISLRKLISDGTAALALWTFKRL